MTTNQPTLNDKARARLGVLQGNVAALAHAAQTNQLPAPIVARLDDAAAEIAALLNPAERGEG